MIRNSLRNIIALSIAAYFLLAGVGYNVVKYCCSCCEEEGVENILHCSCGSYHTSEETASLLQQHSESCSFLRVSLEIPSEVAQLHVNAALQSLSCLFFIHSNPLFTSYPAVTLKPVFPPPRYAEASGRDLLAFKSVLLI